MKRHQDYRSALCTGSSYTSLKKIPKMASQKKLARVLRYLLKFCPYTFSHSCRKRKKRCCHIFRCYSTCGLGLEYDCTWPNPTCSATTEPTWSHQTRFQLSAHGPTPDDPTKNDPTWHMSPPHATASHTSRLSPTLQHPTCIFRNSDTCEPAF